MMRQPELFAEDYCLVFAVFGLEDVEFGVAAQARNAQALVFVGYDDDFSVEIGAIGFARNRRRRYRHRESAAPWNGRGREGD